MIPLPFARERTYAVFGLARSGLAAARALNASGAKVFLGDDSSARIGEAAAAGYLVRDLVQDFPGGAEVLILSPGVPLTHPAPHPVVRAATAAGARIIGDTDLFAQAIAQLRGEGAGPRLVAITGTNGKSTTTALTGHVLAQCGVPVAVGGNIGRAVFDLDPLGADGVYAIEMSSYQIDLSPSMAADVGCLLNITPDHLDRHGSFENYAAVKARLLAQVRRDGQIVIGVDDPTTAGIADAMAGAGRRVARVSVRGPVAGGVYVADGALVDDLDGRARAVLSLAALERLPGLHNAQNIAVTYAALRAIGLESGAILAGIATFPGLAHRLEEIARQDGVRIINDSKATNAEATEKALSSFENIHWIVGGVAKAGGITSLAPLFGRVRRAYLIGASAEAFAQTLGDAVPHEISGTIDKALASALARARPGEVVLLSPAAASFDQFRDFEARGDHFRHLVMGTTP